MRRLALTAAIVGLGALVFSSGAQACSCARIAPADALRRADAAFAGELIEVVARGPGHSDYRYRVRRVYKAGRGLRRDATIAVRSSDDSAACGLPRQTGRTYGILLTWLENRWTSGLCGVLTPGLLREGSCTS